MGRETADTIPSHMPQYFTFFIEQPEHAQAVTLKPVRRKFVDTVFVGGYVNGVLRM